MKLEEIIKAVTVNELIGSADRDITGIQIDSRAGRPRTFIRGY